MFKSVLYFFKKIQISFKTWRNAAEIARAYAYPPFKHPAIIQILKTAILWIVIITVLVLLTLAAVLRLSEIRKRAAAVNKRTDLIERPLSAKTLKDSSPERSLYISVDSAQFKAIPKESAVAETLLTFVKPRIEKYQYIPTKDTSAYFILVVNKAVKSLYVLQKHDVKWRVVREYNIAVGENSGRKITAGDKRTPEGNYFIIGRKEKSELAPIYGPLAYILDYPNEEDRREGRTGQGIWIHGTAPDSVPLYTKGCIELENRNLIELASFLKNGIGTPVIILFDPTLNDIASVPDYDFCEQRRRMIILEHRKVVEECKSLLFAWKSAWERKNIREYETFYDTVRFNGQGLDWTLWKERKLRTFDLYDTIAITLENITVTEVVEGGMIVKFLQRYRTNLNNIENGKKISFEKISDSWKITREYTCPKEELL